MLVVNIRLQYRTTVKVVTLSQLPSSLESVVVAAGRSLSAAIEVCNSAGCSSKANTVCIGDDPSEKSGKHSWGIFGVLGMSHPNRLSHK